MIRKGKNIHFHLFFTMTLDETDLKKELKKEKKKRKEAFIMFLII